MINSVKQFSIPKFLGLAFLPGAVILAWSLILANPALGNLPILLAVLLAIPLGLIPVDLLVIKYFSRKEGVEFMEAVGNKVEIPFKKALPIVLGIFVFIIGLAAFLPAIEHEFWQPIFVWLPDWFRFDKITYDAIPQNLIVIIVVINLIFNGVLGPITEELYFRGFLLPRIERLGKLAPLLDSILFTIYHFFNPFELIFRFVAFAPIAYTAWWKKSFYLSAAIHCLANLSSSIIMAITVLPMLNGH
ncbi:MAG: CPBP family intramembrane metalloprotease [Christensenellaceae bacterium]|jgi:membrane protease YdiL (CAAX protease family)|nr:CPBP family intramembrane metalloprotease [Christensenellaceae bacterium]